MFLAALLSIDGEKRLQTLVMGQFTGPIRTLIENHFVFEPFWRAQRDHDASERWKKQFAAGRKTALKALLDGHTGAVLAIIFDRLYVLRNQLIHGGATWNSAVNRAQVKDGAHLLLALVPILVELMLDHPELDFGGILYPVL